MFLRRTVDDVVKKNEDLMRELDIALESLEKNIVTEFRELGIGVDELTTFLNNRNNFSEEEWEELSRIGAELSNRIEKAAQPAADVKSTTQARAALPINNQWIPVR